ncbi:MAG: deoxyribodipyrimidine photo-lyase, partial [Epsilonproteobacteria bacterium]|nr:deoxyribodipyrimidine photo-lyase [Campylobacterota bacterium]
MKQILWFRRDLRLDDNAILAHAKGEVLPIFIFDTDILSSLSKDDKRVTFIYQSVLKLKNSLRSIGLDLAIFYGKPKDIFQKLKNIGFKNALCSVDNDSYAIQRDKEIEEILKIERFSDSFLIRPEDHLKKDGSPYRVFTPFYKSLSPIWESARIGEYIPSKSIKLFDFDYSNIPSLEDMGFRKQNLPIFLNQDPRVVLKEFLPKLKNYKKNRDFWSIDATSKMSIFLRFGLISPRQIFNLLKGSDGSDDYIRELFWREFYNYILYHFPKSEFENFLDINPKWQNDEKVFEKWKTGQTGVPIIDAAMRYLNQTGLMHNRLRMITASFLTKNLLIDWKWGEKYFAQKLLDYEASSNIGSWQWAASTGADAAPYFRIFNPYIQSAKFDPDAIFIKQIIPELKNLSAKDIHKENFSQNL